MRGVAAASSVWSTAAMNIGSITAVKRAAKVMAGAGVVAVCPLSWVVGMPRRW